MDDQSAAPDLRVSHAEREHVVELLSGHFREGRLTVDEYAERSDTASAARTRRDLNMLLVDLPGAELAQARDVVELTNIAGDLRRHGQWTVPARIVVRSRFGNAHLDCRAARFTAPTVTIDVELGVGNLDIRLPKGASVELEGAHAKLGTVIDRTEKQFERGDPHVVVRGGTAIGNVRVRY
ncbi:DUF1707 SHOCT-like domain-containing protein [Pseudonocardia kunmingensis]|uniref:Uncharacterized protein DUF1707 n=1 Tax=Pseudonocardia kunmingensis TaxID=630975 RepID=A0A543DA92_9PSEU|nr:DUF1707 domain-containing protein [Pseudonocardia kunmingensis]TQM06259.1 uncharacterized protein DUF1707 [Pseudonocardia kunmingensis]